MADKRNDLHQVKALLQAQIEALARELAPRGYRSGKYWLACNPSRDDRKPGSFWIALSGVPGSWRDEATDQRGDVIQLIMLCKGLPFGEAMKWARGYVGIADMPPELVAKRAQEARNAEARRQQDEEAELADKRKRAKGTWLHGTPIGGTVVETYLREARRLDLSRLSRLPRALRFSMQRHDKNGEWPCMLAAMCLPDGSFGAVHRTWLAPDGSGKAPVDSARKIWPRFASAVIHIWRGASDMAVKQASEAGIADTLVLCEGVEDGLALALAAPEYRVWAVGALGNLGNVVLPPCAVDVIVAADNDWGKPEAQKLLNKGLAALYAQNQSVRVARSPHGKDFNDCYMRGNHG